MHNIFALGTPCPDHSEPSSGEIRHLVLVRVAADRTISVMPFCRLDTRCPAYFHSFKWSKWTIDFLEEQCIQ